MTLTEMIMNYSNLKGRTISQAGMSSLPCSIFGRVAQQSYPGKENLGERRARDCSRTQPIRPSPLARRGQELSASTTSHICADAAQARQAADEIAQRIHDKFGSSTAKQRDNGDFVDAVLVFLQDQC